MKKFKIKLAIAIIIMQVIGCQSPASSITLNREEQVSDYERSRWSEIDSFAYFKDSIDRELGLYSNENLENIGQEHESNNCFRVLICQETEKDLAVVSKINILESLQAFKIEGERDESWGIGYVPILARSELGDIYKGVYDYDITLDREPDNKALVLSASRESLNFFVSPKKAAYSNNKKTHWNSFKTAIVFKYDSLGGIKVLGKGKNMKTNNKNVSFQILPANYSGLKSHNYSYSGKQNFGKSNNSKIAKALPKYQVAYSVTDRYRSHETLWQQQIDRKLELQKQQLANQQRQFRIKMEQTLEQSNREQQRQQENLTERKMQELRQDLIKQQQQQSQPIQNYY
jgi:hypothetical protein